MAKKCLVPKSCKVALTCWVPLSCWVPKSCLQTLSCWVTVDFGKCASMIASALPHSLKAFWTNIVNKCTSLHGCEKMVKNGVVSVVEDAVDWIEKRFGKAFDKAADKVVGGMDSFTTMWKKLNLKDTAMSVKDTLLDWLHKVEKAVDKASHGPIHLANTEDGKLCPAGIGKHKLFGVGPTDCGLFGDFAELLNPLTYLATDITKPPKAKAFSSLLKKAEKCLTLNGPWSWEGVKMPHPFFDFVHKDMCLSKSLVDALDVVINLLYNGVKEVQDLVTTITNKVTDWTQKNLLKKLGFLTIEQRRSLPLSLMEGAKCIKGTKDWSIKVKIKGKYKFSVYFTKTKKVYWQFSLGAGVVFGCKNAVFKMYPFIYIGHPAFTMFTFGQKESDKEFKAEGGLALTIKVYFKEFSAFSDSQIKGTASFDVKAAGKNLPFCPPKVKCALKRKFSLLKMPSGELIDFTDTDDILNTLLYTQEVEASAKWEDVKEWFSLQQNFSSSDGPKMVLAALSHLAESDMPSLSEMPEVPDSGALQVDSLNQEQLQEDIELEGSIGLAASWYLCAAPLEICK